MPKNRTVSTVQTSNYLETSFPEIHVVPKIFDFGKIKAGQKYKLIGHISNMGLKRARFRIDQPSIKVPGLEINVEYPRGIIAPGNKIK